MRRLVIAIALLAAACSPAVSTESAEIAVPGDYPTLAAAIEGAPDGATIRLATGQYEEEIVVTRPLTIVGDGAAAQIVGTPGSSVISIVGTDGVTIQGLTIIGGERGISVSESSNVTIADNIITGSGYRGIDVVTAAATVTGNEVRPAPGPYVIGIRVANATTWPDSLISGNVVERAGGYGITVNFAKAIVEGNEVTGGATAGIAINEMSAADVLGNTVTDAPRYGILIHDMSHASVIDNRIAGAEEPIKLTYHSTVELNGNVTD